MTARQCPSKAATWPSDVRSGPRTTEEKIAVWAQQVEQLHRLIYAANETAAQEVAAQRDRHQELLRDRDQAALARRIQTQRAVLFIAVVIVAVYGFYAGGFRPYAIWLVGGFAARYAYHEIPWGGWSTSRHLS